MRARDPSGEKRMRITGPDVRHAFQRSSDHGLRSIGTDTTRTRGGKPVPLRCTGCGHPITDAAARIAVNGAHQHRRTNPAAVTYDIGCFGAAPGVVEAGKAISRHSWFRGFAWRLALCGQCGAHLGWAFAAAGATRFFGLILKRLSPEQ